METPTTKGIGEDQSAFCLICLENSMKLRKTRLRWRQVHALWFHRNQIRKLCKSQHTSDIVNRFVANEIREFKRQICWKCFSYALMLAILNVLFFSFNFNLFAKTQRFLTFGKLSKVTLFVRLNCSVFKII